MKAIVYSEYGSPDVLRLENVDKPTPQANEVLVKVHATSLNASDWESLTGSPAYARISGLRKPGIPILGSDIAGRVEAVGNDVTRFQVGDAVLGDNLMVGGGFAEYVCIRESVLAPKPEALTFEQAAAIPQGGVIALQGLRDQGKLQAGEKLLINGAGGSAGTFALQLAKLYGAGEITGVDNAEKLTLMRSLGADHVIDYRQTNYTRTGQKYDLIIDLVAHHSAFDYRRAITPTGRYLMVGGSMGSLLNVLVLGGLMTLTSQQKVGILAHQVNSADLAHVAELCAAGTITPIIDKQFPLEQTADALRYMGNGHAKGKIVITFDN